MGGRLASALRAASCLAAAAFLFACTTGPLYAPTGAPSNLAQPVPPSGTTPLQPPQTNLGAPPIPASSVHVALLAPQTGAYAGVGGSLVNAVQLALSVPGSPMLDIRDTQSTPTGAAAAAQAAIAAGDQIIIGPLASADTAAVAPIAEKATIPVLAFTNDATQAAPGVWTLGINPAQQMSRLIPAAKADGRMKLAVLLPQSPYGDQLLAAVGQAATAAGFDTPDVVRYGSGFASMNTAVQQVSDYADRRAPIDEKIREARAKLTPEGRKEAADLAKQPIPPPPFDTLVLGATGPELGEIESLLPYYDLTSDQIRFLGPREWVYARGMGTSAIAGGWYAAPDPAQRTQFEQSYMQKYMSDPPAIADVAYDAASLARVLATGQGISVPNLTASSGFAGVDGIFALQADGHVERGLAIFQVGSGQQIQPAPASLAAPPGS